MKARLVLVALMALWALGAAADVAVPPIGRVVDLTNTLSASTTADLEQKLKAFEDRKGSQVAVLIVPTTQPETIEQFSLRVAEQWKLGRRKVDDGALLIVAKDDRKLRVEVGYGLEGVLNDATAKRIIDEVIAPRFRNSDFGGGVSDGVDKILGVIDGEPLPAPAWKAPDVNLNALGDWLPFLVIGALGLGSVLRAMIGRLMASLVMGGGIGLITWFVLGVLPLSLIAAIITFILTIFSDTIFSSSGGGGRSGSSGGGFSSGGSSSSGGGFSGGGGSFGGGGASGSW